MVFLLTGGAVSPPAIGRASLLPVAVRYPTRPAARAVHGTWCWAGTAASVLAPGASWEGGRSTPPEPRAPPDAPARPRGTSCRRVVGQRPGLPPYQYVILRRVERAKQLLEGGTDLSLAEVAADAGFSDQSQFARHFKRLVGVTPGQFRTPARIA